MCLRHTASADGVRRRGASRSEIWAGLLLTCTLPRSESPSQSSNSASHSRSFVVSNGNVAEGVACAPCCMEVPWGAGLLAGARRKEVEEDESVTSVVVGLVQCKVGVVCKVGAVGDDRRML